MAIQIMVLPVTVILLIIVGIIAWKVFKVKLNTVAGSLLASCGAGALVMGSSDPVYVIAGVAALFIGIMLLK
jgi:hypothetical protein